MTQRINEKIYDEFPRKKVSWDSIKEGKYYYSHFEGRYLQVFEITKALPTEIHTKSDAHKLKNIEWVFFDDYEYYEVFPPHMAIWHPETINPYDLEYDNWVFGWDSSFRYFIKKTLNGYLRLAFTPEAGYNRDPFDISIYEWHKLSMPKMEPEIKVDPNKKDFCFDCMTDSLYCHAMTFRCTQCDKIILGGV